MDARVPRGVARRLWASDLVAAWQEHMAELVASASRSRESPALLAGGEDLVRLNKQMQAQQAVLPKVEWSVQYKCTQGYDCTLTLRGDAVAATGAKTEAVELGPNPSWCSVHHCEMRRHEKDGQVWYSHKAPDGTWCRGKAK